MNKEATLQFRTTKEQHKALRKKARQLKIKPSKAMREALTLYLQSDQPFVDREMMAELVKWRESLTRIGTNLNQIAWHMNIGEALVQKELQLEHERLIDAFRHVGMTYWSLRDLLRAHMCYY